MLRDLLHALEAAPAEAPTPTVEHAAEMREHLPRLTSVLARADALGRERIDRLRVGARFRGLDQLLTNLDEIRRTFDDDVPLRRLSFLIERCAADFETAIENALSGYLSVAMDAMRDAMEIENLLLELAVDPQHIDRWLAADARTLRTTYSPTEVRHGLHGAQVGAYASSADAPDYRAHSQALHVGPGRHPIAANGFSPNSGWDGDAAFWEICEHHRRLRLAIAKVTATLSSGSDADQRANRKLPAAESPWQRTQEMQTMYVAILSAATADADSSA